MQLDDEDLGLLPTADSLVASATQYLLSRGEHGAASLMVACEVDYTGIEAPAMRDHSAYGLSVELAGPGRVYDLFTAEPYTEEEAKWELLVQAIRAPLPRRMYGYSLDAHVEARAQVVEPYEGWREEFRSTLTGAGINNQGVNPDGTRAPLRYLNNNFRTRGEIEVAKALEAANALFFPLPRAAVGVTPDARTMFEVDFLVCDDARWGVLEIDGASHTGRYAHDQGRDRQIGLHGVRVIQHFTEEEARTNATQVVAEFLDYLRRNG